MVRAATRGSAAASLLFVCLCASPALAEEPKGDEQARLAALLREGDAAAKAKQWQACVQAYTEALKIKQSRWRWIARACRAIPRRARLRWHVSRGRGAAGRDLVMGRIRVSRVGRMEICRLRQESRDPGAAGSSGAHHHQRGGKEKPMIQRASRPALVRSVLASTLALGTAMAFSVASPAPAAESANELDFQEPAVPCSKRTAECTVTWEADSQVCKNMHQTGKCTTLHQCQAETLTAAKEDCERIHSAGGGKSGAESCGPCHWVTTAADSACRKACEDKAEACEAECRKLPEDDKIARRKCWKACNDEYAECVKKCKD